MWGPVGSTVLYLMDETGNDNWRLFAVDVAGGEPRPLTPEGARAKVLAMSANEPDAVIVAISGADPAWTDVYRISISTAERTLLVRKETGAGARPFANWVVDRENNVRLGMKTLPTGGVEVFSRGEDESWTSLFTIPFDDVMQSYPIGFEAGGRTVLMFDSTGRDRAALVRVDAATGAKTVLGESPRADVVDVWLDPQANTPEAFAADYLRRDWRALDTDAQADLDFLKGQLRGEPEVASRSLDDRRWIVIEEGPTTPTRSYLYDRSDPRNRRLTLLFRHRPALDHAPMQPMIPYEIEARDGLTLVSYVTLPVGSDSNNDSVPDAPVPLVLAPHGGPWSRDVYGYNPLHQWLANRGYAVLSVNYRGSTGFGKAFLNAGNGQWGGRMQEDLLDAAAWAVERGVADPEHIAIFGGSYGGYAAMLGLAQTPDRFACGASFAGSPNLLTLLDSIPAQWSAYREELYLRVGDARTPDGRQMLRERSPVSQATRITNPLLMALGARDPLAARADHDSIAQSIRARRGELVYLVYPDEGHRFARPENRLAFFAVAEHFLGDCLGGRVEPVGASFEGANLQAIDGAASTPGLSAFELRPRQPSPRPARTAEPAGGPEDDDIAPHDAPIAVNRPEPE
jgi:dipeptidyl aminopeptidase/acylaminoacyl peptidase